MELKYALLSLLSSRAAYLEAALELDRTSSLTTLSSHQMFLLVAAVFSL